MKDLEQDIYMTELFGYYGNLLTARQSEIIEAYLGQDESLSEIAERLGIARQTVKDSLSVSRRALLGLEEKLHLREKFVQIQEELVLCQGFLMNQTVGLDEIRKSLARIRDLLKE